MPTGRGVYEIVTMQGNKYKRINPILLLASLLLVDVALSVLGLVIQKKVFGTYASENILMIIVEVVVIYLALVGFKRMKQVFQVFLVLGGALRLFIGTGILISEEPKNYGLFVLGSGVYFLALFFVLIYNKSIDDFFYFQQKKLEEKFNNRSV